MTPHVDDHVIIKPQVLSKLRQSQLLLRVNSISDPTWEGPLRVISYDSSLGYSLAVLPKNPKITFPLALSLDEVIYPIPRSGKTDCDCIIQILLSKGCQCGAIIR